MINSKKNTIHFVAFSLISVGLYLLFAYFLKRENTYTIFSIFSLLAGLYYFTIKRTELLSENYNHFVLVAFSLRLLFLFSIPALSDDFYRFIWDGRLIQQGINPYNYLPEVIMKKQMLDGASNLELFHKMNSPHYYSIYPTVLQLLFFLSAKLSFGYNAVAIFNLRFFILISELGTFFYLKKILDYLNINKAKIFLYLLNPLVIIELSGNLHFEAVMIFFLTTSFYYLMINRFNLSAIFIAFAICTKMIPLLFLPLIVKKIGWKNGAIYTLFSIGIYFSLFLPFIDKQLISNISMSLGLYFQKFEFNASIYYLLREIGFKLVGYNAIGIIGIVLPIISTCLILLISFRGRKNENWQSFFGKALKVLFVYYLFSMIVHPWYITLLILISVFTEYRFAIIWSILIFGSYFAYNSFPFKESLLVNVIEYTVIVLFFLHENKKLKAINVFN